MDRFSRRSFLQVVLAVPSAAAANSAVAWRERRERFPEGVASGDPDSHSVVLWTRSPQIEQLTVEVAEDETFRRVIATAVARPSAETGWTCRVEVRRLKPRTIYWYRFTGPDGSGSRAGRTMTAPAEEDGSPVRFVFVSCQNANQGAQNAYRRMIFEDERAAESDRIGFVLHLGDFIYEIVWYPEDRPQGMYDRRLRDIVRYPHGERISDFHIPTTLEDYRAVYRGYLADPDLQDARARWPFVNMWDNHEFSWKGWQSFQVFDGKTRPAQTRKVAANQAFFEFQPARLGKLQGPPDRFVPPHVTDTAADRFDEHGLAREPNNLTAIHSLRGYRALRWGRNVELIITDQRSYRSEDPMEDERAAAVMPEEFVQMIPEEAIRILDGGRSFNGGAAPASIRLGEDSVPNFRREQPAQTILGEEQKTWFLDRLRNSRATWKIWGNTTATLDMRADPRNLPPGMTAKPWPGEGYAGFANGDHSNAYAERREIYEFVRAHGITGFATVAGDRHSFWAGLAAESLPPEPFHPVGIAFVTGSISAPGMAEALEHKFPKDHPLRPLFLGEKSEPLMNLLLHRGVRARLKYGATGDIEAARALTNEELAPHLSFVDMGGHGYSVVRVTSDSFETEFVCIPRPLERSAGEDGGPLRYRATSRTRLWGKGERPAIETKVVEGDARFSV